MRLVRWIVASAGTGKTTKILELIDSLVRTGTNPNSILCLSFTRHAASELRERYASSQSSGSMPSFETIHSFAKSLISKDIRILNNDEMDDLIKEAIEITLLEPEWEMFLENIYDTPSSILSDIKYILTNNIIINTNTLHKYLAKHNSQFKYEAKLSKAAITALEQSGLSATVTKILSNNLEVYLDSLITKELKINKKALPDSFLRNPQFETEAIEVKTVIDQILLEVMEFINEHNVKKSIISNVFTREVCNKFQELKNTRNAMDFNDLIKSAISIIQGSAEQIMHIQHIFLDEAQDTSELQWKFVYNLLLDVLQAIPSSFTIVGDKKQVIYEFNGASKSIYEQMKVKLKSMIRGLDGEWQEYDLNHSYRTPQNLLDFIDSVMFHTKYPTQHQSARLGHSYVKAWAPIKTESDSLLAEKGWKVPGSQSIPEWISLCISEIKYLLNTRLLNEDVPVRPSDIMILVPRRCINTFLLFEQLRQSGIPIAESPFSIMTDETVQELVGIAEFIIDTENDLLLASILKGPYFNWNNSQIEQITVEREQNLWSYMLSINQVHVNFAVQTIAEWISLPKDVLTFYSKLLFHTSYGQYMLTHCRNELLSFWEKVVQNSHLSLSQFIHYMKNTQETLRTYQDGIIMSTVHGSKGREANIVFLCNSHISAPRNLSMQIVYDRVILLKGNYSLYKNAKNKLLLDQESELERLMYVALTRAKEQLYILPPLMTDHINPKSWYAKIIKQIHLFQKTADGTYEFGVPPGHLTKQQKYN